MKVMGSQASAGNPASSFYGNRGSAETGVMFETGLYLYRRGFLTVSEMF
jgi:hypothetical protein